MSGTMSDTHGDPTEEGTGVAERLLEDEPDGQGSGLERVRGLLGPRLRDGSAAIAVGLVLLVRGIRGVLGGRLRAVVVAAIGAVALRAGIRQRRSTADDDDDAVEEATDEGMTPVTIGESPATEETDAGSVSEKETEESTTEEESEDETRATEDKDVSDEAHAASHRPDHGRETEFTPGGSIEEDPGLVGDDDLSTADDISETDLADETGEATGPNAEHAQPSQTDETEQDLTAGGPDHESEAIGSNERDDDSDEDDT